MNYDILILLIMCYSVIHILHFLKAYCLWDCVCDVSCLHRVVLKDISAKAFEMEYVTTCDFLKYLV